MHTFNGDAVRLFSDRARSPPHARPGQRCAAGRMPVPAARSNPPLAGASTQTKTRCPPGRSAVPAAVRLSRQPGTVRAPEAGESVSPAPGGPANASMGFADPIHPCTER